MGSAGWLGKVPSSSPKRISSSNGRPSKTLGTTSPPCRWRCRPRPCSGRRAAVSTNDRTWLGVLVEQVALLVAAGLGAVVGARRERFLGRVADLGQAGVLPDGLGPGQAELDPVVAGRVVRGGEHRTGRVEAARGEVHACRWTPGRGRRRWPRRTRAPAVKAAESASPDARMSRATTRRPRPGEAREGPADGPAASGRRAGRGPCRGRRRP